MKLRSGHWIQDVTMNWNTEESNAEQEKFHFCLLVKQLSEGISIF